MQKLRSLLGLPVLEIAHGAQIAEVKEVALDLERAAVVGIVVAGATWFSEERGIMFPDLHGLGRDAVTVKSAAAVRPFSDVLATPGVVRLMTVCDKPIFTEMGEYLGVVTDIVCEPATGEVRFYELSDGLITDLLRGRLTMPLPSAQSVGEDRLIVPDATAKLLQTANHDPGGVD